MHGTSDQLSGRQIVRLAGIVPADIMRIISEKYMGVKIETVQDLRRATGENELEFNRQIIHLWMQRNPVNQRQVCKINLGKNGPWSFFLEKFK